MGVSIASTSCWVAFVISNVPQSMRCNPTGAAPCSVIQATSCSLECRPAAPPYRDRKSTRLNSSHTVISYAVFCLKKKKKKKKKKNITIKTHNMTEQNNTEQ